MRVKFETPYGENIFDLAPDKVSALIQQAFTYAESNNMLCAETTTGAGFVATGRVEETVDDEKEADKTPRRAITSQPQKRTRNDSLFGAGWRNQNNTQRTIEEEQRDYGKYMEGYKGFLYIWCPECGKIKGFCTKSSIKEHECDCGHTVRLENLKPMYVHCKCGKSYKYYTNLEEERFEYECYNCGAPIDMKINIKGNTYVTERDSFGGGYH